MFFTELTVENFGPFKGQHRLNLKTVDGSVPKKTLILVGGKNGAGKTTLFEAIRLALHGKRRFGKITQSTYERYLFDWMDKDFNQTTFAESSIRIGIELVRGGKKNLYDVERSWVMNEDGIEESLGILVDGQPPTDMFPEQYQEFLNEIIPLGLADLFFFDGEQIQKLAEEDETGEILANSIRSLLGIDLTSQLRADLKNLIRIKSTGRPSKTLLDEFESAKLSLKNKQLDIDILNQKLAEAEQRISDREHRIEIIENNMSSLGGSYLRQRSELLSKQAEIQESLKTYKELFRKMCEGLLPIALSPSLCIQLKDRIIAEQDSYFASIKSKVILDKKNEINRKLNSSEFDEFLSDPKIKKTSLTTMKKIFSKIIEKSLESDYVTDFQPVHDMTTNRRVELVVSLDTALKDFPSKSSDIASSIREAERLLDTIGEQLERIPDDSIIQPFLVELKKETTELGLGLSDRDSISESLDSAIKSIDENERKLERVSAAIDQFESRSKQMTLAANVRNLLTKFESDLSHAKSERIGEVVTECMNLLSRKTGLCELVEFHPNTYSVGLFGRGGKPIQKRMLSKGEKQILAISILWGLSIVSGRDIPVIIDTPLSRLDSEHRKNIVEEYFPNAGKQVVIFSTDTEVDESSYQIIEENIAQTYHLNSSGDLPTVIEEGYFNFSGV